MIRAAIISLAASLVPCASIAQEKYDESLWTAYADKHWALIADRCPAQASTYAQLTDDAIYNVLKNQSDSRSVVNQMLLNLGTAELTELDSYFSSFVVVNAVVVQESLQLMALYDADTEFTTSEFVAQDENLRVQTQAALALSECIWPVSDERAALAQSRWASAFEEVAEGVCDIHFFTLVQRYVNTPIADPSPNGRQAAGEKLMSDHEQYLEASKHASQCGEFL